MVKLRCLNKSDVHSATMVVQGKGDLENWPCHLRGAVHHTYEEAKRKNYLTDLMLLQNFFLSEDIIEDTIGH